MQYTTKDDVSIDYNIYGNGGRTLIFVHGLCIDQTYWKDQAAYFEKNYKVVTLDLAGHDRSSHNRKQYSVSSWADDVVELIRHLDLKNVILIGHSLGGSVIMFAATKYPEAVKGFVSVDFFKNAGHPLPDEYSAQVDQIIQGLKDDFVNTNVGYAKMTLLTEQTPKEIANQVIEAYKNADSKTVRDVMTDIFKTAYKDEQRLLPQLPVKLHTINVDYMPTNEKALAQYCINGYEVVNIHGTCHYPMLEHAEIFNKKLEVVLSRL